MGVYDNFNVPPWPLMVKVLKDELLSSWLVRLAYNHLQKVHTFCDLNFPGVQIWNRDIDKSVGDSVLNTLSNRTLTAPEDVRKCTLKSYEGYLFEKCSVNTNCSWIMPLQIRHRIRGRCGLMFCPKCLKKDGKQPYYRKKWRLSLSVVCPDCGCYLEERCPFCKSPINFHRVELGRKNQLPYFPISTCYQCLGDLRRTRAKKAPEQLINIQRELYSYLDKGMAMSYGVQYSHLFFNVLHHLLCLFNSGSARAVSINKKISKILHLKFEIPKGGHKNNFDTLSIKERSILLQKAIWLIQEWPERFLTITNQTKTWSSIILRDQPDCPYWFYKEVKFNNYVVFSEWKKRMNNYPKHGSYNQVALSILKRKHQKN